MAEQETEQQMCFYFEWFHIIYGWNCKFSQTKRKFQNSIKNILSSGKLKKFLSASLDVSIHELTKGLWKS
jgi:hypothetical protein